MILIDADLRHPTVHKILDMDNDIGLATLLAGQLPLAPAIRPTVVESLQVVTAGPIPANPAELLSGAQLKALVAELRSYSDVIVVDAPPVLQLADAPLIGAAVDVCVLLVDARSARARQARQSLLRLRRAGVNVVGAVLGSMKVKTSDYVY